MVSSETLRARVDPALARRVRRWARANGKDVSETVRLALLRLLDEEERQRRTEEAIAHFLESRRLGLFEPPSPVEPWKASGFR